MPSISRAADSLAAALGVLVEEIGLSTLDAVSSRRCVARCAVVRPVSRGAIFAEKGAPRLLQVAKISNWRFFARETPTSGKRTKTNRRFLREETKIARGLPRNPTWTQKKPTWTFGEFPQTSFADAPRAWHPHPRLQFPNAVSEHTRERMLRTRPPPLARPSAPRTRGLRGPARLVVNAAGPKKKKLTPRARDAAPPALEVHDNPQPAWLPRTRISHGGGANESNVVAVPRRTFSNADTDEPVYAVVGGHPELALARANSREKISRDTLRALDLDDRRRERPLRPVLPDVSVFAPEGTRRDVFDPTTNARLSSSTSPPGPTSTPRSFAPKRSRRDGESPRRRTRAYRPGHRGRHREKLDAPR